MSCLKNQKILVGVSGGIAAYKVPQLIRMLVKQQAQVRVVMTAAAREFVSTSVLQSLSQHTVRSHLFDDQAELAMSHIELAKWADLILVVPATANIIAKLAHGLADDLLTTLWLASTARKCVAPAMNQNMWMAAPTQKNIHKLKQRGIVIIAPQTGALACGDTGVGRLAALDSILTTIEQQLPAGCSSHCRTLSGQTIVITAGPTREAIDPVRYISNHSSGKMGYALAEAALDMGAEVILISGPSQLPPPACQFESVTTAQQMLSAVMAVIDQADIFIGCAAVADYRVAEIYPQKIKKSQESLELRLIKNPDIVREVVAYRKKSKQNLFCVAFAAETDNLRENARKKFTDKGVDLLAANPVCGFSDRLQGFEQDENSLLLISQKKHQLEEQQLERQNKKDLAYILLRTIVKLQTENH